MEKKKYIQLIKHARGGDSQALEELCCEVEQVVKNCFCSRYTDLEVIEDLSQETYLRFLQSFPKLKDPQKFSFFIAKIALHVHQNHLREKYRSLEKRAENIETTVSANIADAEAVVHPELRIAEKIDLESGFLRLPERTQKVLKMKMAGVRYKEIAQSLNLSVGGVKMIVNRGFKKLKSFFGE